MRAGKVLRRMLAAAAVGLVFSVPLSGQSGLEIFGYLESQYMGTGVRKDFFQVFSNKLRIDLRKDLTGDFSFSANFTYKTFHGKTRWDILQFLPEAITDEVPEELRTFYVFPFAEQNYLDNACIKLGFKYFDLTLGKQQISVGTGYAWNPTDIFNIKDLLDPTYEQPGHNALRLDFFLGSLSSLSVLISPGENWDDSARMLRFKTRAARFDLSLVAVEKIWSFHDYEQFDFDSGYFPERPERRRLLGGAAAGELFGIGVWMEYAYNDMEKSKNFHELVAGCDYTFDFQTYIMIEFYRNTLGRSDYTLYSLTDWMRLYTNEQKAVSRDQIYVYLRHPAADLMNVGFSAIYSFSDQSWALVPTLTYSLSDDVELTAYLNFNFGSPGKAFGKTSGIGGLLRARVYF
jgi:hypothetical protein